MLQKEKPFKIMNTKYFVKRMKTEYSKNKHFGTNGFLKKFTTKSEKIKKRHNSKQSRNRNITE